MNLAITFSGKENVVYDYAVGNMENYYTGLDMSKVESEPGYESLINTQNSVVRFLLFSSVSKMNNESIS